jgi:hypothetical protein
MLNAAASYLDNEDHVTFEEYLSKNTIHDEIEIP